MIGMSAVVSDSFHKLTTVQIRLVPGTIFARFENKFSFGVQEYIEAVSFWHYLAHGSLVPLPLIQQRQLNPQDPASGQVWQQICACGLQHT